MTNDSEEIAALVEQLRMNDEKESEVEEQEPKEAMERLIGIGKPAVRLLLELLKTPGRYSTIYAIEVLGDIEDAEAIQPLMDLWSKEEHDQELTLEAETATTALKKIGLPTLEPILHYLEDKAHDPYYPIEVLATIKDDRAFDALVGFLSHPDESAREDAACSLGEYGDVRAVPHLELLISDEAPAVSRTALNSIRELVDSKGYRSILRAHGLLGKGVEECKRGIDHFLEDTESRYGGYRRLLHGDNAQEINDAVLEFAVRNAIFNMLLDVTKLGSEKEGVISNNLHEELHSAIWKLNSENDEIAEKYGEEITFLFAGHYPDMLEEERRSYRGLARNLDQAIDEVIQWFRAQDFLILISHRGTERFFGEHGCQFWARKARSKNCFIDIYHTQRINGDVTLRFCGNLWKKEEINSFQASFWDKIESILKKSLKKGEKVEYS